MILVKTSEEVQIMRQAGQIAKRVKRSLVKSARAGQTTLKLDSLAEKLIKEAGAVSPFKGYHGFPKTIVTCINSEVVHGIPSAKELQKGDLLTLDLGVLYRGLNVDTALTVEVTNMNPEKEGFLNVGRQALAVAIAQCVEGKHVGDISFAMQRVIEEAGLNVVRLFVGHGVGRELHEEPQIPCFGQKGKGPCLKANMTLAVEVMYVQGSGKLDTLEDGWTVVTRDSALSAMFEETIVVGLKKPLVLT